MLWYSSTRFLVHQLLFLQRHDLYWALLYLPAFLCRLYIGFHLLPSLLYKEVRIGDGETDRMVFCLSCQIPQEVAVAILRMHIEYCSSVDGDLNLKTKPKFCQVSHAVCLSVCLSVCVYLFNGPPV
jgi:hypothetical protein